MLEFPQNAQDFIRALKAASDPPHVGGPFKIQIARKAWDDTQLYVPNKAEAIVDWLLSRLLRDKSGKQSENPISDIRYWELLLGILSTPNATKASDHARTTRAWLVPLLNRIPVAPIFLAYFDILATSDRVDAVQLDIVFRCISILWPIAVPKFTPETLLDCFGAVVQLSMPSDTSDASCGNLQAFHDSRALSMIVSSYRASLSNSTAKKKLYAVFLKRYLAYWLRVVAWACARDFRIPSLVCEFYDAGIETMFGFDIIKQAVDHKHDAALSEAFEVAMAESSGILLRCLPRLFEAYVQNVKRYKGSLFSQGSNQAPGHITEQMQRASMTFYASCDVLARTVTNDASWGCHVSLLEVVEKENLLSMKDEEAKALLRKDGDMAVEGLASAWDGRFAGHTENAVKILATLTRIDYDLMSASFVVVFPRLIAIPGGVPSALHYLGILLDFESRTRNLPSTIGHISEAFSVNHLERIPGGAQAAYHLTSAGPLTSLPFLDELSRAVHNFLTPGQVLDTIGEVSRRLRDAYERFVECGAKQAADQGDGPRKKRKKDAPLPSEDPSEIEYHAVSFVLVAKVMVAVLQSLPLHTVTSEVRLEAEQVIGEVHTTVTARALADGLDKSDRRVSWPWQLVLTGALHLHYALARAPGLLLQSHLHEFRSHAMLSCVSNDGTKPELVLELFRTLMLQCTIGALEPETVLELLLDYLESHLTRYGGSWTGQAYALNAHSTGGIAVLHLLVSRWLQHFDAWANSRQLERLVSILVNYRHEHVGQQLPRGLNMHAILSRMLHDAQFWELHNIRDAFLTQLQKQTASLEDVDLPKLLSHLAPESPRPTPQIVRSIASVYGVLLLTPSEYLPRTLHNEFLRRGFAADVAVLLTLRHAQEASITTHHLLTIREVLRRSIAHLGVVESLVQRDFLDYLLGHGSVSDSRSLANEKLSTTTMNLVDMYQGALIRAAKNGDVASVVDLVRRYSQAFVERQSGIIVQAALLFVDTLVKTSAPADLSEDCLAALRTLYDRMCSFSTSRLSQVRFARGVVLEHLPLDVWAHLQILGRWLNVQDGTIPTIGQEVTTALLAWKGEERDLETLAPVVLSILLGELRHGSEQEHLEYMVLAYLALARKLPDSAHTNLESRLTNGCRTLSAETFSRLLDLVYDGLPLHKGLSIRDIANLLRFSSVLLRDAPQGTSKICQAHTTRLLNLVADNAPFTAAPSLRTEVLNFLVRQCNDRPASLRTVDLSSLWSILRVILAVSSEHEPSSDTATFHGVVNVLSALVRLRRDLVLNTLPHLGFVLRQLVSCLRSLRPQLGGKQSRLVMDTLPRWISATQPLGNQESKALARLLTTLTTKTMVRMHGSTTESQKPESLVRPFSKHAAYVLTAYVEAVNDPLCFVSSGIRKELQPGLFALCEMLGEHNRDAMMVSALDTGGKATMKALWKEYEKQRYVGKG